MKKKEGKDIINKLELLGVMPKKSKKDIVSMYDVFLEGCVSNNKKLDKKIKKLESEAKKSGFKIKKEDIDDYFSETPLSS